MFTCTLDNANNRGVFSSLTLTTSPKHPPQLLTTCWSCSAPIERVVRQPGMSCTPLFLQKENKTAAYQAPFMFAAIDPSANAVCAYNGNATGGGGHVEVEALRSGRDADQQSQLVALHSWRYAQSESPGSTHSGRNSRVFLAASRRNGCVTIASATAISPLA